MTDQGALQRPRLWRKSVAIVLATATSLTVAGVFTVALLYFSPNLDRAIDWLSAIRPALIALQVVGLVLLWHYWQALAHWIAGKRKLNDRALQALLAGRNRICLMFALFELLLVLRAVAS